MPATYRAILAAYAADPSSLGLLAREGPHNLGHQSSSDQRADEASGAAASTLTDTGVAWQWCAAADLSAETAASVRGMLRRNMRSHYRAAEWPAEWRRKQRNVLHRDARHVSHPRVEFDHVARFCSIISADVPTPQQGLNVCKSQSLSYGDQPQSPASGLAMWEPVCSTLWRMRRYLLVQRLEAAQSLVGCVQYRFEEEDTRPVLYLYEVQVLLSSAVTGCWLSSRRKHLPAAVILALIATPFTCQVLTLISGPFNIKLGSRHAGSLVAMLLRVSGARPSAYAGRDTAFQCETLPCPLLGMRRADPMHLSWQVAEEERGHGLGRRMLAAMQRLAQATHMAALMLTVQISNGAARKFYMQCGCASSQFPA